MASVTYGIGRYAYWAFSTADSAATLRSTRSLSLIASSAPSSTCLSNVVASAICHLLQASHIRRHRRAVTTLGLALVGIATKRTNGCGGILLAGAGPASTTPAQFEAIEAWLLPPGRAGDGCRQCRATPGQILTGLAAFWFIMAARVAGHGSAGFGVTGVECMVVCPNVLLPRWNEAKQHLNFRLFARAACIPLNGTLIVYGLLFSVYLIFCGSALFRWRHEITGDNFSGRYSELPV